MKAMATTENSLLNETYMANKYKNYNFFKKELGVTKLLPVLEQYVRNANILLDALRVAKDCKDNNDNNNTEYIRTIASKYFNDIEFMERFLIFEGSNYKRNGKTIDEIREKFRTLLEKTINYAKENNKDIRGRLYFQKTDAFSLDIAYHKKNIADGLKHPNMEITDYDVELYKLERKIGEYETKLNAQGLDLGAVKVILDSKGNYVIRYYSRQEGIKDYYKTFFNINFEMKDIVSQKDGLTKKIVQFDELAIESLVEDYLKGLFWVFDNYFNKNNSVQNANYVSTWIYPHHRSPLLYQVKETLFKFAASNNTSALTSSTNTDFITKMNSLYDEVTISQKYILPRQSFMNKIEHYLYVTPVSTKSDVPDKYKQFIEANPDFFPDLSRLAETIWINDDNSLIIDCRRVSFLNKCNLLGIKFIKFNDFMEKIVPLRDDIEVPNVVHPFIKEFVNVIS